MNQPEGNIEVFKSPVRKVSNFMTALERTPIPELRDMILNKHSPEKAYTTRGEIETGGSKMDPSSNFDNQPPSDSYNLTNSSFKL